jgi:hypothetical protein
VSALSCLSDIDTEYTICSLLWGTLEPFQILQYAQPLLVIQFPSQLRCVTMQKAVFLDKFGDSDGFWRLKGDQLDATC